VVNLANEYGVEPLRTESLSPENAELVRRSERLMSEAGKNVERYRLADAQGALSDFLTSLEEHASHMQDHQDINVQFSVLKHVFQHYVRALHPFMPFITEELYGNLYGSSHLLASQSEPK
jgi:valyl-tRNA synthetase